MQSVGAPADIRAAQCSGQLLDHAIRDSHRPLMGRGGKLEHPTKYAPRQEAEEGGADLIKIFAAGSVRRADLLLSQEQLNAA